MDALSTLQTAADSLADALGVPCVDAANDNALAGLTGTAMGEAFGRRLAGRDASDLLAKMKAFADALSANSKKGA